MKYTHVTEKGSKDKLGGILVLMHLESAVKKVFLAQATVQIFFL